MQNKFARGLYVLVDDSLKTDLSMQQKARLVIEAGIGVLQLRMKRTPDALALEIIKEIMVLARLSGARVIVNDRVDLALLGGADGVHVGTGDVPVSLARRVLGPDRLVGATCRSLEDIVAARAAGADHVGLGPVFQTSTKVVNAAPLGIDGLRTVVTAAPLPVVAIGGISVNSIGAVLQTGAQSAAVASAVWSADDAVGALEALKRGAQQRRRQEPL